MQDDRFGCYNPVTCWFRPHIRDHLLSAGVKIYEISAHSTWNGGLTLSTSRIS